MSRLGNTFKNLKQNKKSALISYFMAGDPKPEATVPMMHALVAAGSDVIELGVPFSDPMADGPVIQLAAERSLKFNTSLNDVLAFVAEFRKQDNSTPVVLMGYTNPVEVMGYDVFTEKAKDCGVDGLITVDLPPEESQTFSENLKANNIDPIFLLSPTTTEERIQRICSVASGFAYYVSLKGVTGSASLDVDSLDARLKQIRRFTDLPIAVGFGIKDADSAEKVSRVADAAVVGSAIVDTIAQNIQDTNAAISQVSGLVASLREAMDRTISEKVS